MKQHLMRDWDDDTMEVLELFYSELSEDWRYRDGHLWNTPTLMLAMMGSFATVLLDVDRLPAWISIFVSTVITLVIFLILLKNVRDRHFVSGSAQLMSKIEDVMNNYLLENESGEVAGLVEAMNDVKGSGGVLRKVEPMNVDAGNILTKNLFFRSISGISSTGILLRLNVLILIVSAANTLYLVLSNVDIVLTPALSNLITRLAPIGVVLLPLVIFMSVVRIKAPRVTAFRKRLMSRKSSIR